MYPKRIISIETNLVKLTGNYNRAAVLSQLFYWYLKMEKKEFYKTDKELSEELNLSKKTIEKIKKYLKDKGYITVYKKGVPAKSYYIINEDKIKKDIKTENKNFVNKKKGFSVDNLSTQGDKKREQVSPKRGNKYPQKGETITIDYNNRLQQYIKEKKENKKRKKRKDCGKLLGERLKKRYSYFLNEK